MSEKITDFKDKNVLVLGLGLNGGGVGVTKYLVDQGANVTVADKKSKKELKASIDELKEYKVEYVFGKTPVSLLEGVDAMVVNPAVDLSSKIVESAKKKGIQLDSEIGIFARECKGRVIAVTGTKGKSTVTKLIYDILLEDGKDAVFGGNIGISLLDQLDEIERSTYVVLEISSFQLDLLKETKTEFHPYIAVITNILKDHLDRYYSFDDYEESKLSIIDHQEGDDYLVAHEDIKQKVYRRKPKVRYFSNKLPDFVDQNDVKIPGSHNKANVASACEVASIINISHKTIRNAVRGFHGLEHRLERAGHVRGVQFYNDSASTTPASTEAALESFVRPVILIAGGLDKDLPLTDFARTVNRHAKEAILIGKNAKDMAAAIKKYSTNVKVSKESNLEKAIEKAFDHAKIGDTVLFSPASASFDMFANSKDRGDQFKKHVRELMPQISMEQE